jgi:ankyrin repeat protein
MATILCAKALCNTDSIDYGRVPLKSTYTNSSLSITNIGNKDLVITGCTFSDSNFALTSTLPITITAGKSGTFKSTGASLNLSDLKSDKYKVTATRFSPAGSTVMIQDKNGDVHRYRMPLGINTYNEGNRDKIMREIPRYQ